MAPACPLSVVADFDGQRLAPIQLPDYLRGDVKYIVVVHPLSGEMYSIGIKHVCHTDGAKHLLEILATRKEQKHRKSLHAKLCLSVVQRLACPYGLHCLAVHCTEQGLLTIRPWTQSQRNLRAAKDHSPEAASGPTSPSALFGASAAPSPHSSTGSVGSSEHEAQMREDWAAHCLKRLATRTRESPTPATPAGTRASLSPTSSTGSVGNSSEHEAQREEWAAYCLKRLAKRTRGVRSKNAERTPPPSLPAAPRDKTAARQLAVQQSIQRLRHQLQSLDPWIRIDVSVDCHFAAQGDHFQPALPSVSPAQ